LHNDSLLLATLTLNANLGALLITYADLNLNRAATDWTILCVFLLRLCHFDHQTDRLTAPGAQQINIFQRIHGIYSCSKGAGLT
jgi:hypothetical protein